MSYIRHLSLAKELLNSASNIWHENLLKLDKDSKAISYINSRNIDVQTMIRNKIGWSNGELWNTLLNMGYDRRLLEDSCLFSDENEVHKNRLTFPSLLRAKALSMASRSIDDMVDTLKYRNLKNNNFSLYSPDNLLRWEKQDSLYVVEGIFDVLRLDMHHLPAISFRGTCGYHKRYAKFLTGFKNIYCLPDIENNATAFDANIKQYIKMAISLGFKEQDTTNIHIILLANVETVNSKLDIDSYFKNESDSKKVRKEMYILGRNNAQELSETSHWKLIWKNINDVKTKKKEFKKPATDIVEIFLKLGADIKDVSLEAASCKCLNPKHEDNTPSCFLYKKTNTYYCFGCGCWGDGIGAVRMVKNCSYTDAVKFITGG